MEYLNDSELFFILGTLVVGAPILLLITLGLSTILGKPLREHIIARATYLSIIIGITPCILILILMILKDLRFVPIELGNLAYVPGTTFHFNLKFIFDRLSVPFCLLTFVLCGIVGTFTRRYLHKEIGYNRFFICYAIFFCGMIFSTLAGTIETLFIGWELVGLSSALLIAYFHQHKNPVQGGLRVWSIYRFGDAAFLLAVLIMHHMTGHGEFDSLIESGPWPLGTISLTGVEATWIGLLLLVSACAKSGLVPFSGWLPRAMEGPTPSSAVFYGSLSVHLGAYMLLRLSPIVDASIVFQISIIIIGVISAIFGSVLSKVQPDVKSSLGFASMTQVSIIFIEIGLGFRYLALVHIMGHACLRTLQLLRAPSILKDYHSFENAIGETVEYKISWFEKLSEPNQVRLYRLAYERGGFDNFIDRMIVIPFQNAFKYALKIEEKWLEILNSKKIK